MVDLATSGQQEVRSGKSAMQGHCTSEQSKPWEPWASAEWNTRQPHAWCCARSTGDSQDWKPHALEPAADGLELFRATAKVAQSTANAQVDFARAVPKTPLRGRASRGPRRLTCPVVAPRRNRSLGKQGPGLARHVKQEGMIGRISREDARRPVRILDH